MSDENYGPAGTDGAEAWIGQDAVYGGYRWSIDSAVNAVSNLPSRTGEKHEDGSPVNVPLKHVYAVLLVRFDDSGTRHSEGVFGCAYCGLLRDKRGQITAHLNECTGRQEPAPDYMSMSVSELVELAKLGARADRRITKLEERLRESETARRAAERELSALGRVISKAASRAGGRSS